MEERTPGTDDTSERPQLSSDDLRGTNAVDFDEGRLISEPGVVGLTLQVKDGDGNWVTSRRFKASTTAIEPDLSTQRVQRKPVLTVERASATRNVT